MVDDALRLKRPRIFAGGNRQPWDCRSGQIDVLGDVAKVGDGNLEADLASSNNRLTPGLTCADPLGSKRVAVEGGMGKSGDKVRGGRDRILRAL